jgi:hypothetical protein
MLGRMSNIEKCYKELYSFIPSKYTEEEKKELVKTALNLAYICLKYKKIVKLTKNLKIF